jgi:hypothetical protein
MPLIRSPPVIDRNLDRSPDELGSLRGSLSLFLGVIRVSGDTVHGEVSRDTVGAVSLPETNRHHSGRGAFHEGSVGGYGSHED